VNAELAEIQTIVGLQLGYPQVLPHLRLVEDLGAESGDFVVIIATLEERYDIVFAETELAAIRTTFDLYQLVNKLIT